MDVILHIGMGKNGSSAIQRALRESEAELAAAGTRYLGMWVPARHEEAATRNREWMAADADLWRARADAVLATKAKRVVISNESFSGTAERVQPFVERLMAKARLRVICYARDPRKWLPSAHVQWSVRHKTQPGPVQSFTDAARRLVGIYSGPVLWREMVGDALDVVSYDRAGDVVEDFSRRIGVALRTFDAPVYGRPSRAETVMRALFNDRIAEPVLPDPFDRAIASHLRRDGPRSVVEMAERALDTGELEAVMADRQRLFARFEEATGLDVLEGSTPAPHVPVDAEAIRNDVIDYLAEMAITQAIRLRDLEEEVAALRARR